MDSSQRYLKERVIASLQERVQKYEEQVTFHRYLASEDEKIANWHEDTRVHRNYVTEQKNLADQRLGRSPELPSLIGAASNRWAVDRQVAHEASAFTNQMKADFYAEAAKRARKKLFDYQQLDVEEFTEQLVNGVMSEPLEEYSDGHSSKSKHSSSSTTQKNSSTSATTVVAGAAIAAGALWLINKMRKKSVPSSNSSENDTVESNVVEQETLQNEKVIISCPNCPQNLRVPSNRGELTLTCPKCKHTWLWSPK